MEQSPSWEANWSLASQEIPRILWKLKFHYRIDKNPPSVPTQRPFNLVRAPIPFVADTRVGTLIVATIYLQLIQNRYMFRSSTVLHCSHQHCVQPVCQRCGSRRIPLAAPVVLIVRMERSTAWRVSGTVLKRMSRSGSFILGIKSKSQGLKLPLLKFQPSYILTLLSYSRPGSLIGLSGSPPKLCINLSSPPYVLYAFSVSWLLIWHPNNILEKIITKNYSGEQNKWSYQKYRCVQLYAVRCTCPTTPIR